MVGGGVKLEEAVGGAREGAGPRARCIEFAAGN